MAIKQDAAFDSFVSTAQSMLGSDLSRDWLFEIWVGADADANRALNHVLDSPEDKVKRNGGGGNKSSGESKPAKKSKPQRESKPAPATPATTWGDDDWGPPASPPRQPAAAPQQPPPQQYQQPPSQPGYPQPQPMGYPQTQPMGYPQTQPMGYPQSQPMGYPQAQPQPMGYPQGPQFMVDPIQQAQTMFVQQQQQQRLMALKASIDSVLSSPGMLMNPQIMQNLQDTMIQALEAPNATLQMAERARQSQQTASFIHIMQGQVAQMLSDPRVATNPALLQQLNSQMNQLRLLTMQHVAQQQIDANPATALSLSMPLIAPASASAAMLSRAMMSASQPRLPPMFDDGAIAQGVPVSNDDDWWSNTPKASKSGSLSEKNPFREDTESSTPIRRSSSRQPSVTGFPQMMSMPSLGMAGMMGSMPMMGQMPMGSMPMMGQMPMGSMPMMGQMPMGQMPMGSMPMMGGQMPMGSMMGGQMGYGATPLSMMYGSQQAGYNPLLQAMGRPF